MLAIERRQYAPGGSGTVLAVSELSRQEILETIPAMPPENVAVLHYGIDVERFHPARRRRPTAPSSAPSRPSRRGNRWCCWWGPAFVARASRRCSRSGAANRRRGPRWWWRATTSTSRPGTRAARDLAGTGAVHGTAPRRRAALCGRRPLRAAVAARGLPGRDPRSLGLGTAGGDLARDRRTRVAERGPLAELLVDDPRDADAVAARLRLGLDPDRRATLVAAARAAGCANGLAVAVDRLEAWCRSRRGAGPAAWLSAAMSSGAVTCRRSSGRSKRSSSFRRRTS